MGEQAADFILFQIELFNKELGDGAR